MAGLWDALKQYIGDALPGGALNPETQPVATQANYLSGMLDPASQVSQDAQAWHKRTQNGLMDQLAGRDTPEAEQAYQTMMQAAGMAPVGMIAWHGSPHKFDKFSLDKIGTGEGAQAYGHGLYLAEDPAVGAAYRRQLSGTTLRPDVEYRGQDYLSGQLSGTEAEAVSTIADALAKDIPVQDAITAAERIAKARFARDVKNVRSAGMGSDEFLQSPEEYKALLRQIKSIDPSSIKRVGDPRDPGNLYKVDIPDEAVARFLDWDKPLSQDSPQAFKDAFNKLHETYPALKEQFFQAFRDKRPGNHYYSLLNDYAKTGDLVKNQTFATNAMRDAGIPGIRYLDGGSRGTGTGTSNFVAFDPELIRILERNGQPTGLQPWKPGEWKR